MKRMGKMLSGNRGIAALCFFETLKKMDIATVAVYTEQDKDALHVGMADEAYQISNYLDMKEIIDVARKSGAVAVHGGWGYQSENPDFARACQEAGILWIGSSAESMEKMGDKVRARELAKEAGLPVLPGIEVESAEQAIREARRLGFPLVVKGAAGGGGISIHLVHTEEQLIAALPDAKNRAQWYFGSNKLLLERFLPNAWQIEVQIVADEYGKIIHLFDRDCSTQWANQKRIEEAPVPEEKLDFDQRYRIWNYAVKLVRHIGYVNVGTVEFLVSAEGEIYFLEMNTRLQVEYRVTEMVTGLDLVKLQIRIAQGKPLPFAQQDIQVTGHALEVRLCKEHLNNEGEIVPGPGLVEYVARPAQKPGGIVKVDALLVPGRRREIPTEFGNHLMSIVVWDEKHRQGAITRMEDVLRELHIVGHTNKDILLAFLQRSGQFRAGVHTTELLKLFLESSEVQKEIQGQDFIDKLMDAAQAGRLSGAFMGNPEELLGE